MVSERDAILFAEFAGLDSNAYIIAGRACQMITQLRIQVQEKLWEQTDRDAWMKLWAVREYIVRTYRRPPTPKLNYSVKRDYK